MSDEPLRDADRDYRLLLDRGSYVFRFGTVPEREEWRAAIRARARADKLPVRTGVSEGTGLVAYAILYYGMTSSEMTSARERLEGKYGAWIRW